MFGEVFTPPDLVNRMLDMFDNSVWFDPNKTVGDITGCGNGNFLVEVLRRKLDGGSTPEQALSTIFGIEILEDNVKECRKRLMQIIKDRGLIRDIDHMNKLFSIVKQNIVHGDALLYDWNKHPNGNPEGWQPPKINDIKDDHEIKFKKTPAKKNRKHKMECENSPELISKQQNCNSKSIKRKMYRSKESANIDYWRTKPLGGFFLIKGEEWAVKPEDYAPHYHQ